MSLDDVQALQSFAKAQKLNFSLLSDPDGSVARKYGVLNEQQGYANRVTFVLDPKGVIRHVESKVNVRSHGKDLLEQLKKLGA